MSFLFDLSLMKSKSDNNSNFPDNVFTSINNLETLILHHYGLKSENYYILCSGKKVLDFNNDFIKTECILQVIPRTLGGKGGFGSMLRAIGAQIEKTTNREACRDLSGRRLRDINEEQRLKNWIAQQADREREAAERKKKKLERLCQEPKHDLNDDKYDESRSDLPEKMSSSIEQGFKASSSGVSNLKRKHDISDNSKDLPSKKKKKHLWIDAEESDSSSVESDAGQCEAK